MLKNIVKIKWIKIEILLHIEFDTIEYETGTIYCSIFVQNCLRFVANFHKTGIQKCLAKIFEVCSLQM